MSWIDANPSYAQGLVLCEEHRCADALWPRESEAHDGSTHVGFWLAPPDDPPPALVGYLHRDGEVGSHASAVLVPQHSALVEVPEPHGVLGLVACLGLLCALNFLHSRRP